MPCVWPLVASQAALSADKGRLWRLRGQAGEARGVRGLEGGKRWRGSGLGPCHTHACHQSHVHVPMVQVAGWVRSAGPLTHAVVYRAGHMVPHDQPLAAQQLLEDWALAALE